MKNKHSCFSKFLFVANIGNRVILNYYFCLYAYVHTTIKYIFR